jgi:hypothetical protein
MLDMDGEDTWKVVNFISKTLSEEEKKKLLFYIFRGYDLDKMMVKRNKIVIDFGELDSETKIQYLMDGVY